MSTYTLPNLQNTNNMATLFAYWSKHAFCLGQVHVIDTIIVGEDKTKTVSAMTAACSHHSERAIFLAGTRG